VSSIFYSWKCAAIANKPPLTGIVLKSVQRHQGRLVDMVVKKNKYA